MSYATLGRAFFAALLLVGLSSCASSYRTIDPPKALYNSTNSADGVTLAYHYNVLGDYGNRKYAKKENKKGLRVVAVRITNNTATPLKLGENLRLKTGDTQEAPLVEPRVAAQELRQNTPTYLLYLLLGLVRLNVTTGTASGTEVRSYPIGLVIGPGLTIANMAVAGGANTRLKRELTDYNLIGREIKPGETVHGLVTLRSNGFSPLTPAVR